MAITGNRLQTTNVSPLAVLSVAQTLIARQHHVEVIFSMTHTIATIVAWHCKQYKLFIDVFYKGLLNVNFSREQEILFVY